MKEKQVPMMKSNAAVAGLNKVAGFHTGAECIGHGLIATTEQRSFFPMQIHHFQPGYKIQPAFGRFAIAPRTSAQYQQVIIPCIRWGGIGNIKHIFIPDFKLSRNATCHISSCPGFGTIKNSDLFHILYHLFIV